MIGVVPPCYYSHMSNPFYEPGTGRIKSWYELTKDERRSITRENLKTMASTMTNPRMAAATRAGIWYNPSPYQHGLDGTFPGICGHHAPNADARSIGFSVRPQQSKM